MNPEPELDAAIAAVESLQASVNGLRDDMQGLRTYGHRNRRFIATLAVSFALDLILTVVVAILAVKSGQISDRANEATSLAARNRDAQIVTCQAGNESRAAQRELWTYVLDLVPRNNPNLGPDQLKRLTELKAHILDVFAPRDCNTLPTPTVSSAPPTVPTR